MDLLTCRYSEKKGWFPQLRPSLDSLQTLIIVFAASEIMADADAMVSLQQTYPQSTLVGCSTAGEIYDQNIFDDSLVAAIIKFSHSRIKQVVVPVTQAADSHQAGIDIAESLLEHDLSAIFILADGMQVNGSALIDGMTEALPSRVIITGGLAADGDRFEKCWIQAQARRLEKHIVAVGLYGDRLVISHGSRGGWDILGPTREVTRSTDNVLYQLDGQPALALYKKYLGERAQELPSAGLLFPLAIQNVEEADGYTVRTIMTIDEAQQSITFAGNIPQGALVQLMYANFDRLIDGAAIAAEQVEMPQLGNEPILNIAISCVGRRLVLNQRAEEEVEAVREVFPENVQLIGFYSYGEISPLASGRCDLHNQTMTLTLITET